MSGSDFQIGEKVRHAGRPEWGTGRVEKADRITHQGQAAQRLIVTFPNHGRVTLNTAFAVLQRYSTAPAITDGLTMNAPSTDFKAALTKLPEPATDILSTYPARLAATLELYTYSKEPRRLFEWAVAQTHVDDPLSHMTRHELEQAFEAFALNRDRHLRKLAESMRKEGKQAVLHEALHNLPNATRQAVGRAMRGR